MTRKEGLWWGSIFLVIWMGRSEVLLVQRPWWVPLGIGASLILYSYFKFNLHTFLKIGLALIFLGNDYLLFVYSVSLVPVLLLLKSRAGFVIAGPQRWISTLLVWCFVSYVFSQYIESNLGAFWFYAITFASPMVLFSIAVQFGRRGDGVQNLCRFLMACLLLQSAFIAYAGFAWGLSSTPGDWAVGSLGQPDISFLFAGGFLFVVAIQILRRFPRGSKFGDRNFRRYLALAGWLALMLYLTYTRVLNYSLLIALAVGLPSLVLVRRVRPFLKRGQLILGGCVLAGVGFMLIYTLLTVPSTTFGATYTIYATHPEYNHKFVFLKRALSEIPDEFGTGLTGTGPGTVGSRAANSRAYDTLFKLYGARLPSFIPPFTSEPAKKYFVDLYQEDFVSKWWKSQTLAAPFSSLITLLVELGLIGIGLFLCLIVALLSSFLRLASRDSDPFFRALGITLYFVTLTIFVASLFDTYLERPLIMGPYWIVAGLAVGRLRAIRQQSVSAGHLIEASGSAGNAS